MKKFTAQVDEWIAATAQRLEAVIKQSSSDVIDDMQTPVAKGGNMPVDTGFLRNSIVVTLNAPTNEVKFATGGPGVHQPVEMVIAGAELGETIYAVFTANYAGFVNYGVGGRPGRQFVGLAAQKWQSIVSRNAARLRASTSSRG